MSSANMEDITSMLSVAACSSVPTVALTELIEQLMGCSLGPCCKGKRFDTTELGSRESHSMGPTSQPLSLSSSLFEHKATSVSWQPEDFVVRLQASPPALNSSTCMLAGVNFCGRVKLRLHPQERNPQLCRPSACDQDRPHRTTSFSSPPAAWTS